MSWATRAWPYAAVAGVAALLFARGPFAGHPLYFRDLSLYFFPLRRFALAGIEAGVLRYWNPYVHEGEPLALPPISYPFDLLQLLRPDEVGISFVLALHVPLAALWMMALCRKGLGLSAIAAAGAGLVYSLGGFALSTVNLYVYAQALAWAPAAVLGLLLAARGGRRAVALGAVTVGILVSTTAAEMVAQAIVVGVLLALPCPPAALLRMAAALALGAGLAAPSVAVLARLAADSARAAGFPPEVVLSHSIHPLTLVQVVVAGFYGDTSQLTERWWGVNFFPRGFPYFLSLYLGLATLVTALVGAGQDRGPRRRLAALAVVALLMALGRWGLGAAIVEAFEPARSFRYPSKLFFTVHVAVALLAALGLDALAARARGAWRRLAAMAFIAGALLASAPLWPRIASSRAQWFASGFFPPAFPLPERMALLDWVLRDGAIGGAAALAVGAIAVLAARGRLAPHAASLAVVGLIAADLLRAGAGLNPATTAGFFTPSAEVARHHAAWRAAGRVFTCAPGSSEAYALGRAVRADHERWTFAVLRDTLAPAFNVSAGVPSALSPDLTMLVPPERLIDPADAGCASIDRLVAPLRLAGVGHVISLDPLVHPDLAPESEERPPALAPLTVRAYALRDPRPMAALMGADGTADVRRRDAGRLEVAVTAPLGGTLHVREAYAAGWKATVDGRAAGVQRAEGRHIAVAVPAGAHAVVLDYDPPGLRLGAWIALASALVILGLVAVPPRGHPSSPGC
jgi:membrane protein YfhO